MESQQRASPWWRRLATAVRSRGRRQEAAEALYAALVRQARSPFLFAELGVPDTRDGRLEMILLHAALAMRRLQLEGRPGQRLAQALFDWMFADIDQHLREWGVGDLSVGKQVKRVAQVFYARAAALEPALAARDPAPLLPVLLRNVYGDDASRIDAARQLAHYLVAEWVSLEAQPLDLENGPVVFASTALEQNQEDHTSAPRAD